MVAKKCCVYCRGIVPEERAMDVCDSCGKSVWGEKMFRTIIDNTNSEMAKGNMELGRVSET
jgi:RNA polymerase subunit RPABC4/transcription elongation factor Spt4